MKQSLQVLIVACAGLILATGLTRSRSVYAQDSETEEATGSVEADSTDSNEATSPDFAQAPDVAAPAAQERSVECDLTSSGETTSIKNTTRCEASVALRGTATARASGNQTVAIANSFNGGISTATAHKRSKAHATAEGSRCQASASAQAGSEADARCYNSGGIVSATAQGKGSIARGSDNAPPKCTGNAKVVSPMGNCP